VIISRWRAGAAPKIASLSESDWVERGVINYSWFGEALKRKISICLSLTGLLLWKTRSLLSAREIFLKHFLRWF
jgi:hypothetical protein